MNPISESWLQKALILRHYKHGAETIDGHAIYNRHMRFAFITMLKAHPMN